MAAASPLLSKANSSTFERSCLLVMHSRRLIRAAPSSGRGDLRLWRQHPLLSKANSSTFERSCLPLKHSRRLIRAAPSSGRGDIQVWRQHPLFSKANSSTFERSCLLILHSRRLIRAAPSSGRGDLQVLAAASPLLSKANSSTFERSCLLMLHSRRLIRASSRGDRSGNIDHQHSRDRVYLHSRRLIRGTVVGAWGDSSSGGSIPSSLQSKLINIREIVSTGSAFAFAAIDTAAPSSGRGDLQVMAAASPLLSKQTHQHSRDRVYQLCIRGD